MKRFFLLMLLCGSLGLALLPGRVEARTQLRTGLIAFRLQVAGTPDAGATFWVAYGPLAGKFGIIRLHRNRSGMYVARARLPLHARTVFSYLEGQGTIQARFGLAPGNPVVTIRQVGPMPAGRPIPPIRWQAPLG